ncbi:MAG TPA: acyl-CoA dehydrogenase [Streptosporangiaceae bacterium]|nr:acyl-CoA dehydrogenase [Streptosporangiaceae bacterium]
MPIAVTTEQLAIAESVGQWAKRTGTIAAVRDLEARGGRTGGGPAGAGQNGAGQNGAGQAGSGQSAGAGDLWAGLADLGIFSIALPDDLGGGGGTAADVAVVAETLAAALVPGPVLPTLLAGLVLASSAGTGGTGDAFGELLGRIAKGAATFGVALSPGGLTGAAQSAGGLRVSGTAPLVLGAGDASHLLLAAATDSGQTWFLLDPAAPGVHLTQRMPVDFSRALSDVSLDDVAVGAGQVLDVGPRLVPDLAVMLAAAEAAGIAAWCSQTATEYARTRQQFGRPIGSFQAIKHLCAQLLCRAELATAAAWGAACAADQAPDELSLAAAAAGALALDAAVDNAKDCIQVLGGIGFTWEHDAHLYLRRALALRSLLGGSAAWRARAAGLALGGLRRHPFDSASISGDNEPSGADLVRAAARVVANAVSATPRGHWRDGLAEIGYAAPAWPPPYGLSAGPAAQMIIDEELARAGLERPDLGIGGWAIPAILNHGTTAQLDRFAGPTLRGEIVWCQLFSEPEAGSDLASLRTKAVRAPEEAGGGWRLTGQKVWTSLADEADWAICLARTDPAVPKHQGITYFLVSMHEPGIEVRPLREITGRAMFNEVFLDDVFVPDDCVVGEPGEGWRVARTTLATERVAMVRGAGLGEDAQELLTAAQASGGVADPVVLDQVGARLAESLALSVMDDRLAGAVASGAQAGQTAAVRKLIGVAHRQAVAETAVALAGVQGAAADGAAAGAVDSFLLTRCLSIAGGTSQILLSLVAERVLGLPREEAR